MKLFEVFLAPGGASKPILSDELCASTGAQVMTVAEATFVGLEGIPDDPEGRDRRLIACKPSDERLIASRLEASDAVASFRVFDLG
jgi:hypothetical protein